MCPVSTHVEIFLNIRRLSLIEHVQRIAGHQVFFDVGFKRFNDEVNVAHQDANQAWPALVAKAFGADFHNISWSGAGVVWNAGAGCSADAPFHDLYSRSLGSSQKLC